ncbi:MAG: DUF2953 domain-containing protein [Clostridia bacterium]|nr:DUF2953 domain-containing protein [Clostridia bacterium]
MLEKREKSMLFLLALIYLLLCVRLRVQLDLSIAGAQGGVVFTVGALGVNVRHEAEIMRKENGMGLRLEPHKKKGSGKKHPAAQRAVQRVLAPYLKEVVRLRRIERLMLHVRLGLGDACETAVAAGGAYALLSVLAPIVARLADCDIRVTPDFAGACFHVRGQGIFFCQLGDIMLAALKAARRKRREGLKWTNIPLRA